MGNDSSRLRGLVIDKNAVEANDFWSLYNAEMPPLDSEGSRQFLSVFQGEAVVTGQLWVTHGPLERAIKNFMIYRHPYILKYVDTWEQGGQKHLATERVRPLIAEVGKLTDIQVCLGLRTILCSLIFLIEKAKARHINICLPSIQVADDGSWRLAGFEYVWKANELSKKLLDLASAYRYKAAIDPEEMRGDNIECIEQFAFATLCEEILSKCSRSETETPFVNEFREYCATHLKHKNTQMRPKLSAVLLHPYFNHEFVLIHSFLIELPLKSVAQKQEFFTSLVDRLRCFREEVVGAQLAELLLSRMVLLDPTAQLCVTPYVLKTKSDHSAALFNNQNYSRYIIPHIKRNFRLRDAQMRLILLEYFIEFARLMPKDELETFILPHLQAGMRDTNDVLVAKTMRCLADLVPILGSAIVVGGERSRLFSDGRPQAALADSSAHWVEPRSITPVMEGGGSDGGLVDYMVSGSPLPANSELEESFCSLPLNTETSNGNEHTRMPPRLSPDGGEDVKTAVIADGVIESESLSPSSSSQALDGLDLAKATLPDDDEAWSDWETDELQRLSARTLGTEQPLTPPTSSTEECHNVPDTHSTASYNTPLPSNASLADSFKTCQTEAASTNSLPAYKTHRSVNDDINALDIIVQQTASITNGDEKSDEFDFFKDMQPVIEQKRQSIDTLLDVAQHLEPEIIKVDSSRFAAAINSEDDGDQGWGVDDHEDVAWSVA